MLEPPRNWQETPGEFSAHADLCRAFGKSAIQRSGGGGATGCFCQALVTVPTCGFVWKLGILGVKKSSFLCKSDTLPTQQCFVHCWWFVIWPGEWDDISTWTQFDARPHRYRHSSYRRSCGPNRSTDRSNLGLTAGIAMAHMNQNTPKHFQNTIWKRNIWKYLATGEMYIQIFHVLNS